MAAAFSVLCVQPVFAESVSFVACPIAQDTGPDSDLCFFAMHNGQRISLAIPEFDSAGIMLKHRVLVEGVVQSAQECGGRTIVGQISPLPEVSPECNEIRPFDGKIRDPDDLPPSKEETAALAEIRTHPDVSLQPMRKYEEREGPAPSSWTMPYTFDSDRGDGPSLEQLVALVHNAVSTHARTITIEASQGPADLDDGTVMQERSGMSEQRARKIAGIIAGLGYPADQLQVRWKSASTAISEPWTARTVRVTVSN